MKGDTTYQLAIKLLPLSNVKCQLTSIRPRSRLVSGFVALLSCVTGSSPLVTTPEVGGVFGSTALLSVLEMLGALKTRLKSPAASAARVTEVICMVSKGYGRGKRLKRC